MTTSFKAKEKSMTADQASKIDAFYPRGDRFRAQFGDWDCCDSVAHAISDLFAAQNSLAEAIADWGAHDDADAAVDAAIAVRTDAILGLIRALIVCPRPYQ